MDKKTLTAIADRQLIDSLGGPAQLAKTLGFTSRGGVQRVHNWKERGIPAAVKLQFPEIFLVERMAAEPASV